MLAILKGMLMELRTGNRGFKGQVRTVDQVQMENLVPLMEAILVEPVGLVAVKEVEAAVEASIHLVIFQKLIKVNQEQGSQVVEIVEVVEIASILSVTFQKLIKVL